MNNMVFDFIQKARIDLLDKKLSFNRALNVKTSDFLAQISKFLTGDRTDKEILIDGINFMEIANMTEREPKYANSILRVLIGDIGCCNKNKADVTNDKLVYIIDAMADFMYEKNVREFMKACVILVTWEEDNFEDNIV